MTNGGPDAPRWLEQRVDDHQSQIYGQRNAAGNWVPGILERLAIQDTKLAIARRIDSWLIRGAVALILLHILGASELLKWIMAGIH